MANNYWSSFNGSQNTLVAGISGGLTSNRCNNAVVAGITSGSTCFGPPFFVQRLQAFQGVPVCICTENDRCVMGTIMEVCADYLSFNNGGHLEIIPLSQITRVSLAPHP
ncbi:MAG TPA: DUF2642 domain-containing protein [Firmicutes bacterium]|jgi:hypothetical protein|nr:DUF2642 domain-containing protein [Bacillota bacterium]